ncbi:MAG: response regulator [Proteobacteria bacterium]|nr:response regulator [Pseudomonadota bacterium]
MSGKNVKILIVDDSRAMRAYIRGVLQNAYQCTAVEVQSGFEALRLLPREQFDLIVTDINMPDINGLELIRFVRESKRHASVPILIISTQSSERDKQKVFELGANSFVAKPFKPDALIKTVAELTKPNEKSASVEE